MDKQDGDELGAAILMRDLRLILLEALTLLDKHYAAKPEPEDGG